MWSTNSEKQSTKCGSPGPELQQILLDVAEASIRHGLQARRPVAVDPAAFAVQLREPRATFVTLHMGGQLRGCVGTVEAVRSLIEDVSHNAFQAAFCDPRFLPLQPSELSMLDIDISVLSPLQPIEFADEADLLDQIRPGVDGLVLEYGPYRGLLLPDVWGQLPDKRSFLDHLKLKANLPPRLWSNRFRVHRFTTQKIARSATSHAKSPHVA